MPLCRGSRREDVCKIARKFRLRDQGGWAAWIHGIFVSPGGVGHGGVVFSYEPRTPDSRGVGHGGVVFSYEPRTPGSGGGLAMGGSFSATNHVLPIPAGKARPTGLDFRGIAPECVYRFSRWRRGRLAGTRERWPRTHWTGRFEVPGRPVLMLPGPIFPPVSKRAGKERPAGFFGPQGGLAMGGGSFSATNHVLPIPGGVGHGGGHFQLQTAYSRFRRRKSLSNSNFTRGPGSNVCTDFPGLHFRGVPPLVVKQIRYELATMYVMLIPGPFWPPDWYQKAHLAQLRER